MTSQNGVLIIAACVCLALVAGGCSAGRINLAKNESVSLQVVPSKSFNLEKVSVYQEDNNVTVKGQVWLTKNFKPGDYGHIDIETLDAQNNVIEKHSVFHQPRILPLKGTRPAYFKIGLNNVVQKGSTIRVKYHQPDNDVAKVFCLK